MKKLIIGNWKNHPATEKEAMELFEAVKSGVRNSTAEVVVCPPSIYLSNFEFRASNFIKLGAQNITNEFSAETLKTMGVEYVILGHSDVRKAGETNEMINKKIQEALDTGLKVILCVGENEGENRNEVLEKQLSEIKNLKLEIKNLAVAYEPIWAIGNGKNCDTQTVSEVVGIIKNITGEVKVLYGGSVNSANAQDYLKNGGVDGLLIGRASLNPEEFIKIAESIP